MRRAINFFSGASVLILFNAFIAYVLLNWALGCGESFPQADGSRIQGECFYVSDLFTE